MVRPFFESDLMEPVNSKDKHGTVVPSVAQQGVWMPGISPFGHAGHGLVIEFRNSFGELDRSRASRIVTIAPRQNYPRLAHRDTPQHVAKPTPKSHRHQLGSGAPGDSVRGSSTGYVRVGRPPRASEFARAASAHVMSTNCTQPPMPPAHQRSVYVRPARTPARCSVEVWWNVRCIWSKPLPTSVGKMTCSVMSRRTSLPAKSSCGGMCVCTHRRGRVCFSLDLTRILLPQSWSRVVAS